MVWAISKYSKKKKKKKSNGSSSIISNKAETGVDDHSNAKQKQPMGQDEIERARENLRKLASFERRETRRSDCHPRAQSAARRRIGFGAATKVHGTSSV